MNRKLAFLLLLALTLTTASARRGGIRIRTGIEVLKADNFKILEGKRVGLITNPTGVDNELRSDIDILHSAPGVCAAMLTPDRAWAARATR